MTGFTRQELADAKAAGAAAFAQGLMKAPAIDQWVRERVRDPVGTNIPLYRAWSAGWQEACTADMERSTPPLWERCISAVNEAMHEMGCPPPDFQLDDPEDPEDAVLLCYIPDRIPPDERAAYGQTLQRAIELTTERIGWPHG